MAGVNPRISVIGLYNYDSNLFANMWVPTGLNKPVLVDNLLMELGELQVIYPDPEFMKEAIKQWSISKTHAWQKIYDAIHQQYNPLWNKDGRVMEIHDLHLSDTDKVAAFNSSTLQDDAQHIHSDNGSIERLETGNIGLTSSQELMMQEVTLWQNVNLMEIIIEEFKQRFCIMVY